MIRGKDLGIGTSIDIGRSAKMKTRYNPNTEYKNGNKGSWLIIPDCGCNGVNLQAVDTGEEGYGPFSFDGNTEEPTFSPSVYPEHCPDWTRAKGRCHFFVVNGVAEHCPDSVYPNEKRPLLKLIEPEVTNE